MNNLKRLVVSLSMMSVLAAPTFAGETAAPPCAPGETAAPPCSAAQLTTDDPVVSPGQTDTPSAPEPIDLTSVFTDVIVDLLLF